MDFVELKVLICDYSQYQNQACDCDWWYSIISYGCYDDMNSVSVSSMRLLDQNSGELSPYCIFHG